MADKITIRKLAAELKMSPATVYRALSGFPNMRQETRRAVLKAAHRKGYLLPVHEKRNIAIIIPSFAFSGYLECLLLCLENEFHSRGFHLELIPTPDISLLGDHMFDGIVSLEWDEGLEKMLPQNFAIPILTINAASNTLENIPRIISDPKGIRMALDYLYDRGCRKIFYFGTHTKNSPDAAERLEEFRQFCLKTGQDFETLHQTYPHPKLEDEIAVLVKMKADACFCVSESLAAQIGHLLKKAGLRIPQDISLMGLEDRWSNECFTPPITAIRQNFEQIAAAAAENIAGKITAGIPMKGCRIPFTLIERESVRNPEDPASF